MDEGGKFLFKQDKGENQLIDKVVYINRVAKVVKAPTTTIALKLNLRPQV